MFMKKRITFIATLLILACVALAGSSVWAAQSMKPEDVIAYNKSDPNSAPYTKISLNNMTIYYEGTGYSSVLGAYDISVNVLKLGTPTSDGDPTYTVARHFPINATTPPNVCKITNGTIKGQFTLTPTDLMYLEETWKRGVKVEVYIVGMKDAAGNQIPQTFSIVEDEVPPVRTANATFLPAAGSQIRTFFTTSVEVVDQDFLEGDSRDPDYNVYSWMKTKKATQDDTYFTNAAKSSEFANPAYLTLNAQSFTPETSYDLWFLTKDLAANLVTPEDIDTDSQDITFKWHATTEGDDAYTFAKVDTTTYTSIDYQVYIPMAAFSGTHPAPPTTGTCIYNIGGQELGEKTLNGSSWDIATVAKWAILTIGSKTTGDTDFSKKVSLWSKEGVTVGMYPNGPTYTYFGAKDKVGPVLLRAQIDVDGKKTILTFSEPLDKTVALDKGDFEVDAGTPLGTYSLYKSSYAAGTVAYDTESDNKIILSAQLQKDRYVRVITLNHLRDKNGNRALTLPAKVLLGRKVQKVEVTGVGFDTTTIKVTFNGSMLDLDNEDNYWVTLVPGLEKATGADTKKGHASVTDAVYSEQGVLTAVTLTVDARITDTSANGLPQVIISDDGMENLKGCTTAGIETGETLIGNNKGLASIDQVGPYILSGEYNRHASDKQPLADVTTYHVMSVTFSEPVQCQYLFSPKGIIQVNSNPDAFGYDSTFVQTSGLVSKLDINMGKDTEVFGDDLKGFDDFSTVTIVDSSKGVIRDGKGNSASITSSDASYSVILSNPTIPWITKVTTQDSDYNGLIDALIVTWNEALGKEFSNRELVIANTKVKDAYYINPNIPSWDDRNPISLENVSVVGGGICGQLTVPLKEKKVIYDTVATPGLTLYLDSANYLKDISTPVDGVYHMADKTVEILSTDVTDGVAPFPIKISYRSDSSTTSSGIYTVSVKYSELIDPNVYGSDGDPTNDAKKDFTARTVKDVSVNGKIYKVIDDTAVVPAAGVTIDKYNLSNCSKDTVAFKVTVVGNEEARKLILDNTTFVPKDYAVTDPLTSKRDTGVFDLAGNFALSVGTLGSGDSGHQVVVSGLLSPSTATDPVTAHEPKRSAYSMMLYGTVTNVDGAPVTSGWSIYAYSQDNLYRFKHTSRYPQKSIPNVVYLAKAEHDPNCVKGCAVDAILAPDNSQGGTCYGSAYIQADGTYTMYAYNNFFDTPGFNEGDPMFLVLQAPALDVNTQGKMYLMNNNCKADNFYLTFTLQQNNGIKQYNIDLRNYESKQLANGWNFFSTSTLKRYVLNGAASSGRALQDEMNNPVSASICPVVTVDNLSNVLTSLNGQWSKVYFVDGAKDSTSAIRITSRDPKTGTESGVDKIEYFSIGYGYWIYIPTVNSGAELVVLGKKVMNNDPQYHLSLNMNPAINNVNMVGYWGGNVYYIGEQPEKVTFSSLATSDVMSSIDSIDEVFEAFKSGLSLVKASYDKGPQSWYSPVVYGSIIYDLSDLSYFGPGYGYYMVINQDCNVKWPLVLK